MIRIIHFPFQYLTKHYPFQFNSYPFQFNPYPFHYLINAYPFQFNPYPFQYSICDLVLSCIRILVLCIICILIAKRKRLENVYKILFFSVLWLFFSGFGNQINHITNQSDSWVMPTTASIKSEWPLANLPISVSNTHATAETDLGLIPQRAVVTGLWLGVDVAGHLAVTGQRWVIAIKTKNSITK